MRSSLLSLLFLIYHPYEILAVQKNVRVSVEANTLTPEDEYQRYDKNLKYEQQLLADELRQEHELCFTGENRSPVNIDLGATVPIYVSGIEFFNYNITSIVKEMNSSHTEGYKGFNTWENPPYIKGATLEGEFVLWEYHQNLFHPSHRTDVNTYGRVGHSFNDIMYDYEGHLVHVKRGMTLEEAQGVPGAIVIIAVEFMFRDESLTDTIYSFMYIDSSKLSEKWAQVVNGSEITAMVQPSEFLPKDTTSFFKYSGSLAQAPCTGGVTWFVLAQPVIQPSYKIYEINVMSRVNQFAELVTPKSLGSRIVYVNYGEQKKPMEQHTGYPTYVLVLVTLTMVALTCAASFAHKKLISEKPNAVHALPHHDDTTDTTRLVDSELLFSL